MRNPHETQLRKPARDRASYSDQYKQEALERGVPAAECGEGSSGAGIRPPLLYPLGHLERESNAARARPKSKRSVEALEAEIRRLRAENAKLLEQREVLKKITGQPPRSAAQRYARIQQMSGPYKQLLCEALRPRAAATHDWKKRHSKPGPRQMENMHCAKAFREDLCPQSSDLGSPEAGSNAWLSGRRNRNMRVHARRAHLRTSAFQVSRGYHRQPHGGPIAPNRLRVLALKRPDQAWTTDALVS